VVLFKVFLKLTRTNGSLKFLNFFFQRAKIDIGSLILKWDAIDHSYRNSSKNLQHSSIDPSFYTLDDFAIGFVVGLLINSNEKWSV
jgi:hypothetical protein